MCPSFTQWCIAKNEGGYTQRGVAKGLKVPCLFMITEVSIRCRKNPEVGIPPNTPLHSLEPQPSVCHATDQQICRWSVGQDSPSRCALCSWDRPNRKSECNTRSAVEPPHTAWSTGFKSGLLGGHTDGSMKFGTVRCTNSTVDFAWYDGALSCWNTKWSPDVWRISGRRHRCSRVSL